MARPTLMNHRKFFRLQARLKLHRWGALGVLEALWQPGYECGDPTVGDALDLAARVGWDGDPEALAEALLDCGFLDAEGGRYSIHDFWHHAPDYVRKRAKREAERRGKSDPRRDPDPPKGDPPTPPPGRTLTGQSTADGRSASGLGPVGGGTEQGASEGHAHISQEDTGRPVADRSLTRTPLSHHPSLPVKIKPGNIASQSSELPNCPDAPGGHPPKSGEATPMPWIRASGGTRGGGFQPLGTIARGLTRPRGDPEPEDELGKFLREQCPEISDHQRAILRRMGLELQGAYRVKATWERQRRAVPIENHGAYLWRMLETEARQKFDSERGANPAD